jgi:[acyl-carrier-protein] S-malonyltransferase
VTAAELVRAGRYVLVFPGAGCQRPAMAYRLHRDHEAVRGVLQTADEATGLPLTRICLDGTRTELRQAGTAHPAIVTTGVAAAAALREHLGAGWHPPALVGGHSLGHFAALVEAGVLTFADAVRVVATRARLMGEHARLRPPLMVAVTDLEVEQVTSLCAECPADFGIAVLACHNGPGRCTVSGDKAAVEWVAARAARRVPDGVRVLATGVGSHSPLMRPVQEELRPVLEGLPMREPVVPVLLNSTGRVSCDLLELRDDLRRQLEVPVRWHDAMKTVAARRVPLVLDAGPGQVLARTAGHHAGLRAVALNAMEPLSRVMAA